MLAYANYSHPFIINVDASGDGLGAVLCQEQEGIERVVAYASRGLRANECNYPAHKLEFLAVKWAVCDKFHDYLYGNKFMVRTDNNTLTYVLTTAKLDATGHRWLATLSSYNFQLQYKSGRKNQDADALSRLPAVDKDVLLNDTIKAICQSVLASPQEAPSVECVLVAKNASVDTDEVGTDSGSDQSQIDWHAEQTVDSTLNRVMQIFTSGHKSRKENPQKLTQLSSRSHSRHLVGKRTAQKDTIIDITSDSQVNSNFPYRWSPASLTFYNYFTYF